MDVGFGVGSEVDPLSSSSVVGLLENENEGVRVGDRVGIDEGRIVEFSVGAFVGDIVEGILLGNVDGFVEEKFVGYELATCVGTKLG